VSNPLGDSISQFAFFDEGGGNGHFTNNGAAIPDGQWTYTSNLSDVDYVGGSTRGPQTLEVGLYDATTGTWSTTSSFTAHTLRPGAAQNDSTVPAGATLTVSDGGSVTIGGGSLNENTGLILDSSDTVMWITASATAEIPPAYEGSVTFEAPTGTLILDDSAEFSGTISGLSGQDALDLKDINFATVQTPTYSGTSAGGSLAVTDGAHTADIHLSGNYLGATFVPTSDSHGGTMLALHA